MPQTVALSTRVREESASVHSEAETSALMTDLLEGRLSAEQYAELLAQLQHVYAAIDDGARALRDDPQIGGLLDPRLDRTVAIAADLAALGAAPVEPTAATRAYVERVNEVASTWPLGFLAHHYTRYLGDLSGGMVMAKVLGESLGLTPTTGLAFFQFDIGSAPAFKRDYRDRLDALGLSDADAQDFIAESRRAYGFNLAMFDSVGAAA